MNNNNECIKFINEKISIHPILNTIDNIGDNNCYTLPYINEDDEIVFIKQFTKDNVDNSFNTINNFIMPINSTNFLDIVFNINNINKLEKWINELKDIDIKVLNIVLDLFWIKHYMEFDKNYIQVVNLNKTIIQLIFKQNKSDKDILEITEKFIRNNFNKKINYLNEIKKYLKFEII